jgi:two-component system, OmpR family, osmolarity sensor histidine kinase EnvZ
VLKSLRSRNLALLVGIVMAGQLLTILLVWFLAIRPQAERVGEIMARNVTAISMTMDILPPRDREALILRINRDGAIRFLPGTAEPPQDRGIPTRVEAIFMKAFVREMRSRDPILWRGGRDGQMWVQVSLGDQPYWISSERPKGWSPNGAILASFLTAVSLALIAGVFLQRRIAQPLRALANAADSVTPDGIPSPLETKGPTEIAAVARSFNLMGERLSAQEAERTFMLAGISHDLRTPLAKIRLALALEKGVSNETEELLSRQLDGMDAMLGQFLGFARGIDGEPFSDVNLYEVAEAAAQGLDSDVTIIGNGSMSVRGRPIALQRAITNLLRNAFLYGTAPVSVKIEHRHGRTMIAVRDAGKGVPPDKIETLALPFVRGDQSRTSATGTGLGLAIARHIAVEHGGTLTLRNLPCGGFEAALVLG